MKKYTANELRKAWKDFYIERGHVDCGAVSLVSDGATGVLFNVAGMQPLMPYLLGQKHPLGTRLCNVQGCIRTIDIDSVGDKNHGTFFEMMGSWSLGDYFKEERCKWSFELLTQVFGFEPDHLAATVFAGDENAPRDEEGAKYRIASGFKPENIYYLPKEDNWWGLEFGPCGPDSEMFYVKDDVAPCGPDCKPGCHCGKYTEIGNDVFMQYEKHEDGTLTPLAKKNVDTGWGLERNLAFLNGLDDVYKTDVHSGTIAYIEQASGYKYDSDEKLTRSMRIIADHTRTAVMLIGDEAKLVPSNAGAGYVLRRLIRRAVRNARMLGLKKEDILKCAEIYIGVYRDSYTNLVTNHDFIIRELGKEISQFETTIENGMKEFKKILDQTKAAGSVSFDGDKAFFLYDTFGFPLELTVEMAAEEGLKVDEDAFKAAMERQKETARAGASFAQKSTASVFDALDESIVSSFTGYDTQTGSDRILAMADDGAITDKLVKGQHGTVIVGRTPFYATMGGQKGDKGVISTASGSFSVEETVKIPGGRIGHIGTVTEGSVGVGEQADLKVDTAYHASTCRNHSATHLLQAALQQVLGHDAHQQGSYQDDQRTRFDFSYGQAMTAEEIAKVEAIVNDMIAGDAPVITDVMSIEDAKKTGAMALFGEKYGESVRVVSMGDYSKELCGGTHVKHTGEIANFKILSESGVAAGVRRIEAVTGANVIAYYKNIEEQFLAAAKAAKTEPVNLSKKIEAMQAEIKALNSDNESLKSKLANASLGDAANGAVEVKGVKVLAIKVADVDMNGLRNLGDQMKEKLGDGIVFIASACDGKVNLMAMATDGAIARGAHAGNLIKAVAPIVQGGGGGRPNMAQAGGKDASRIDECVAAVAAAVEGQIH